MKQTPRHGAGHGRDLPGGAPRPDARGGMGKACRGVDTGGLRAGAQGMTALQIGCLAANTPARGFYEAIGGRLVGERLFDEDGVMLPEVVYEWADIQALAAKAEPDSERRSA